MKITLVLVVLVAWLWSCNGSMDRIWKQWKREHGKVYDGVAQEAIRRQTWDRNMAKIREHNHKHDQGQSSFRMGQNRFSDMTWAEFKKAYLANAVNAVSRMQSKTGQKTISDVGSNDVPDAIDWRTNGSVVTSVKDQGECKSSWAFSVVGAVEGAHNMHYDPLEFSEQQLIDCSSDSYDTNGCDGGNYTSAMLYGKEDGLQLCSDYIYEGKVGECKYDAEDVYVKVYAIWMVPEGSEGILKFAVAKIGPTSAELNVNDDFQHYSEGIYMSEECNQDDRNYATLVVGYGAEDSQDFWILKNSWGTTWGEEGYMRFARNENNMCGIASWARALNIWKQK